MHEIDIDEGQSVIIARYDSEESVLQQLKQSRNFRRNGPVHDRTTESKRWTNGMNVNRKSGGVSFSVRVTRNCMPDFLYFSASSMIPPPDNCPTVFR